MYREQLAGNAETKPAGPVAADKVLVVIPCLNECDHIEALLAGLIQDTAELDRLIVVVDGGSTDGTTEILADIAGREPALQMISNPKKLQSAGMNLAAMRFGSGRQWLARLDAHAVYPTGYIKSLIAEAHSTGASSVVVAMVSQGSAGFQSAVALVQNSVLGAGGAAHRRRGEAGFVDHGHHALFDLKRFLAVGGYDENVSHNEDAEFDVRLARAGGTIWLTRAVEIIYFPRSSVTALYQQYANYGRGRAATILRHRKVPKLRQLLPACVAPAGAALLFSPWLPWLCLPALFWCMLCVLSATALGMRQGVKGALFAPLAAMTIHVGWSIGFWREVLTHMRHRDRDAFNGVYRAGDAAS